MPFPCQIKFNGMGAEMWVLIQIPPLVIRILRVLDLCIAGETEGPIA